MALSMFDEPETMSSDDKPLTAKRYAAKRLKEKPIGAPQQDDDSSYSQVSSMSPGKPTPVTKQPDDADKQQAIRRRLRNKSI